MDDSGKSNQTDEADDNENKSDNVDNTTDNDEKDGEENDLTYLRDLQVTISL